jgi:hypothetical protein
MDEIKGPRDEGENAFVTIMKNGSFGNDMGKRLTHKKSEGRSHPNNR